MNKKYGILSVGTALVLALSLATSVAAQDSDGRWTAFYGCWEPVDDSQDRGLLCVRPEAEGVEFYTVVDGVVTTSDLLVANGVPSETSVEGCEGWESASFSRDGRRVFTSSEFVCGEETPRAATGVMSLVSPTLWIDVRSVDVDGEQVAWVQSYRLADPKRVAEEGIEDFTAEIGMAVTTARMAASSAVQIDDVAEASEAVGAKAVEAWIAARGDRFMLDADELIRMADAGIPESVIDVVVAVSFPETFQLQGEIGVEERPMARGARGARAGVFGDEYGLGVRRGYGYGRYGYGRARYGASLFWDPFYYGYSSYRNSYGYGYGSYGYPYGGYYYTPITVVVEERNSGSASRGRVVNGRGYTRTNGSSGARSGQAPRQNSGGGGSASSAPPRSSGGAASSGGSSTGRKAKPRGGR